MLAYDMDGQPLSRAHGAPLRMVIPEMYGYKNTKWVNKIVVSDTAIDGYWEQRASRTRVTASRARCSCTTA